MNAAARPLFVATILLGSFLLFLIQPMVARMALPRFGGTSNVWNSAMIVYQTLLLGGYAYAHWLSRYAVKRQATIHLALLVLCAFSLPIALVSLPVPQGLEVFWVPLLFLLTVGPAFFIVSAQAPMMQRWFAADPHAGAPWALYAASNLGSFAGLVAYPLLAEPLLPLAEQSTVWGIGYGLLVLFVAACAWTRWRAPVDALASPADGDGEPAEPIPWRRRLLWLALAAVPSGMMLSTTTHLTTDIFAMPLLWVLPLGLYLLSFTVAFSDFRLPAKAIVLIAPLVVLGAGGLTMISRNTGSVTIAIASIALLFVVATALHTRLYDLRPHPSRLTSFYLTMSLGGALGGAFTAIIAPLVFDWVWEHPLLLLAAVALMPLPRFLELPALGDLDPDMAKLASWVLLGLAAILAYLLYDVIEEDKDMQRLAITIWLVLTGTLLAISRIKFAAVLVALMLVQGGVKTIETTWNGERTRSYFGVYTVLDYPEAKLRMLVHGSTLHGQQWTDPELARLPSAYYGPTAGSALVLENLPPLARGDAHIGVLGLGVGTLACFAKPGQDWTFFEIDDAIRQMSRDGTFTYHQLCTPEAPIVLGDARLKIADAEPGSFDVLFIDAFSSDSVPLHLITQEAIETYLRALSDDGVLMVHISNRYIELETVVAAIADNLGLAAIARHDNPANRAAYTPTSWIALARERDTLQGIANATPDAEWHELDKPAERAWTDDYASILPHIRWRALLEDL